MTKEPQYKHLIVKPNTHQKVVVLSKEYRMTVDRFILGLCKMLKDKKRKNG